MSASWSGEARKWACDVEGGKLTSELVIRASDHRITGIDAFDAGDGRARIVTGHADGSAAIWNADGSRAAELKGHASRCGRVAFHPHGGKYVATASFDNRTKVVTPRGNASETRWREGPARGRRGRRKRRLPSRSWPAGATGGEKLKGVAIE